MIKRVGEMKWGREVHIGMSDAKHCRIIKLNYISNIVTLRLIASFSPQRDGSLADDLRQHLS